MVRSTILFGLLISVSSGSLFTTLKFQAFQSKTRDNLMNFARNRATLLDNELEMSLGYNLSLNPMEEIANEVIVKAKSKEIAEGFFDPSRFSPAYQFQQTLDSIRKTSLYHLMQTMPKGGILHSHDTALGSTKILIDLTYKKFCWICVSVDRTFHFTFSRIQPQPTRTCDRWQPMEDFRRSGISDEELTRKFQLTSNYTHINDVWSEFESIFGLVGGILGYKENFEEYIERTLQELLDDGVQYVEMRSSMRELHDLDGNRLPRSETAQVIEKVVASFVRKNPSFIGAKLILSRSRRSDPTTIEEHLREAVTLKNQRPDFMCGFDLVGQEDLGKPLKDFMPKLLSLPNSIDYFSHAGETNWYGTTTDENLFDAVMLRSKRIGHGFALNKHPLIASLVKQLDICIEVNPISNQVLQLVKDLRNHPAAYFIANNFPMVISSDDPSFWGASPLTDDFYVTFLGIASAHADLRLLKQLAINSIKYSCMSPNQKNVAFEKWTYSWNRWIQYLVSLRN